MKFTPGKWWYSKTSEAVVSRSGYICSTFDTAEYKEGGMDEVEANAKLICAAPELYGTITGIISAFYSLPEVGHGSMCLQLEIEKAEELLETLKIEKAIQLELNMESVMCGFCDKSTPANSQFHCRECSRLLCEHCGLHGGMCHTHYWADKKEDIAEWR